MGRGSRTPGPRRARAATGSKLQRWIDLLAALLRRHGAAPLEELVRDVPAYQHAPSRGALRRTFERDKDELRAFGIPIATISDAGGEVVGYRLKADQFYLPYLTLMGERRATPPRRVDRYGYRALAELTFDADELEAVAEAARGVAALGDPMLVELAASAMRKLAFDLPVDAAAPAAESSTSVRESAAVRVGLAAAGATLEALDDALRRRKRTTIEYYAIGPDAVREREVEPFGLFFLGHHWYLAARDSSSDLVKNFRVSRIHRVTVNSAQPGTPDYDVPAGFSLREHARSRQAWELGDAAALDAVVEFRGASGPAYAARRLGEPVADSPSRRRFSVRRLDSFARWLLSFAGEVAPVSPPELVEAYHALADAALAAHGGAR
ncbi:MAG TPA: WYL domain-containing protein [Gemmatimonadales bacterium]|nr:WYL domain-containing protein [Gemmatimonadales bacterium]